MSAKITVIVEYIGYEDYKDVVSASTVAQAIKVHAIRHFGLEPGSEDKYVLQYHDADIPDRKHIGDFAANPITLTLILKDEVKKG